MNKLDLFRPDFWGKSCLVLKGTIHYLRGDLLAAETIFKGLFEKEDTVLQSEAFLKLSNLYLLQGKYDKCKNNIIQGIRHSQKYGLKMKEPYFFLFLAYLNLQLMNFPEALEASEKAREKTQDISFTDAQELALHLRGLAYLQMNKIVEAENTAGKLRRLIEKTGKTKHMRHYYHLIGMIALRENRVSQSIENLKKAVSLLSFQVIRSSLEYQSFFIDSLASAYNKSGNKEKAQQCYERITSLTTGRLMWADTFSKSFFYLGKIYQERGWEGKAIENYEKFLKLWKSADSRFREPSYAEKQLAVLRK